MTGSGGERVPAFIEPLPDYAGPEFAARLARLGATNVEEIVPGIWTAYLDAAAVDALKGIAGITPMDKKSPSQR